ncbi:MAG: hypothetical protein ACE5HY_05720 [Candidatus Hydrothermarchaeales archaeon]
MIEDWLEDKLKEPEDREKLFRYIHISIQLTNVMIVLGVIILIILILKPF